MKMITRYLNSIEESFFLFGPRGTGKSTWLKATYPDSLYIDLLSTNAYISYTANPERLKELIEGNPQKNTIIIDEIQRVPALLTIVHQLIEEKKELQFIMTGSSARKLKRTGVDLLGGRALLKSCYPFMATELGDKFDFIFALENGLLPLVVASTKPAEQLGAYSGLYLREEVQNEGIVRNIGNFARFLEAISFSQSSVLNVSEVARECEVERKTVEGYITILEDLLLSYRLPVFNKRAKRNLIKHSKFYFFDTGVFRTIRPKGPLDRSSEITGQALEGLVLQHLKAWNEYSKDNHDIYFWRTKSGVEIDFVIYGEKEFVAIEVKNSDKVHSKDLRNLSSFKEDYPEAKPILLYRGTDIIKKGTTICIPCDVFLKSLLPGNPVWK